MLVGAGREWFWLAGPTARFWSWSLGSTMQKTAFGPCSRRGMRLRNDGRWEMEEEEAAAEAEEEEERW